MMLRLLFRVMTALTLCTSHTFAQTNSENLKQTRLLSEFNGTISYSPIMAGYNQFLRDYMYHFWDRANVVPRIRPTHGNGYVENNHTRYTYWQMAEAANILYWEDKMTHSADIQALFQSKGNQVISINATANLSPAYPAV